jgi:hypothetical protein
MEVGGETSMSEQWRSMDWIGGLYEISSLGTVRSKDMIQVGKGRAFSFSRKGKIIAVQIHKSGYRQVTLRTADGPRKTFKLHRLVCEAFNGAPPSENHQAAHCDGDLSNNTANNLVWKTPRENCLDRVVHGTQACGERMGTAKLTEDSVRAIRAEYGPKMGFRRLASRYGVDRDTIRSVVLRHTWRHV